MSSNGVENFGTSIDFPDVLFGDLLTTKRNWQHVLRRFWETSSWERALEGTKMVSFPEDWSVGILLTADSPRLLAGNDSDSSSGTSHFRAHWITSLTPIPGMPEVGEPLLRLPPEVTNDDIGAWYSSVLDGMRYFWFAIAFYGDSSKIWWYFFKWDQSGKWAIGILRRLVYWLPEVLLFIDRLKLGLSVLAYPILNSYNVVFLNGIWRQLASLFDFAGLPQEAEFLRKRLRSKKPIDIVGLLLRRRLVRIGPNGRPELSEVFKL
jgi:hypothetical protein